GHEKQLLPLLTQAENSQSSVPHYASIRNPPPVYLQKGPIRNPSAGVQQTSSSTRTARKTAARTRIRRTHGRRTSPCSPRASPSTPTPAERCSTAPGCRVSSPLWRSAD